MSMRFEARQRMRESLTISWAFVYITVKSRIWWAFLTGIATEHRKLAPGVGSLYFFCYLGVIQRYSHREPTPVEISVPWIEVLVIFKCACKDDGL